MSQAAISPDRETFLRYAAEGNVVAVSTELVSDAETPISAFTKLSSSPYSFLLESAETNDQVGKHSFVGSDPVLIFRVQDETVTITRDGGTSSHAMQGDPLSELERVMAGFKPAGPKSSPWFCGGAVGLLGYDAVRYFEPTVGNPPPDDLKLPEAIFMLAGSVLVFDHKTRRLRIVVNAFLEGKPPGDAYDEAVEKISAILKLLDSPIHLPPINAGEQGRSIEPSSNTAPGEYCEMVRRGQEYIKAGDIFQFVPSQRFSTPYEDDPISLYRALRFVNPSPYMFCLRFADEFTLVGSSPEVHVRAVDRKVEIRPIAGTRRRGANADEDSDNAADLIADPKERAEHIMLVDLARNDVGRIADYKSVEVTDLMIIERYSHVMHIVSNVIGHLHADKTAFDVMRATFPAGTVSGSPKIRAMQIIYEMEKNKRGAYAGAVGYFGFDGNLDSCIVLRTITLKNGTAYVQAGGGVVADSTPEGEFQETVNKAMASMKAISLAKAIPAKKD